MWRIWLALAVVAYSISDAFSWAGDYFFTKYVAITGNTTALEG